MPDLIAHRGFAADYPENTVTAVAGAASDGADMVEVDVRAAADGTPVVVHDATVDRVTDATGRVEEFTPTELREFDVLNSGDGIPTLDAVLENLPDSVGINVEIKDPRTVPAVLDRLDGVVAPVLVSSFSTAALRDCREIAPGIDRALLVDRRPRSGVDRALDLDCTAVHPRGGLCMRSLVVRRAHNAGLTVNAWTVQSARTARWLGRLGVEGLIADTPSVVT